MEIQITDNDQEYAADVVELLETASQHGDREVDKGKIWIAMECEFTPRNRRDRPATITCQKCKKTIVVDHGSPLWVSTQGKTVCSKCKNPR